MSNKNLSVFYTLIWKLKRFKAINESIKHTKYFKI